jgi:phytoene dehydrogenase-like protein
VHALRDGSAPWPAAAETEDGPYDLAVVGGGISGLAAAHFFRAARPGARVLLLDNHDDFGGHAQRNKFRGDDGRLMLMNGGTMSIDSPRPYSAVADGLLRSLGVDPVGLERRCSDPDFYGRHGCGRGVFLELADLLAETLKLDTAGAAFEEHLRALRAAVDHHAGSEERSMFAEAQRLGEARLRELGRDLEAMLEEQRTSRFQRAFRDLKVRLLEGA